MAQLKADSQGFLIGESMDISRAVEQLRQVKNDVAAIRRAIIPAALSHKSASTKQTSTASANIAASVGRSASLRPSRTDDAIAEAASRPKSIITSKPLAKAVEPKGRDSKGRFTAGGINGDGDSPVKSSNFVRGVADRLATAVRESAIGGESVDPTIKAAQEVAEPLRRGYSVLFGGEDKQSRWLKKIFKTLNVFHKEETVYNKASAKVLKSIEEKTGLGGDRDGGFSGGAIGSLLGRFLPWLFGGLAAAGSAVAGGIGGVLTPVLATIFSPIGAAVAAAGVAAWGLFTESGQKFFSDIGGNIAEGWNAAVTSFKETFPGVTEAFEESAAFIADVFKPIIDFFKDKFGIVADVGKKAVDAVSEKVGDAKKYLTESSPKTMAAVNKVKDAGGKAWEGAKTVGGKALEGIKSAGNWVLGQTSKLFESGKGGAATVSTGKGDFGGASYGTYQLSSKAGTLQNFLKSSKYGEQFAGLAPGSSEFNAKWKDVAKNDPAFGNAQHEFIKNTHFDPAMAKLSKSGIDLSSRGAAVQDSLWSTSVQFGAGGGSNLIKNALSGKDAQKMSDAEIVAAIQDYKLSNNDRLFASSSAKVREGTAVRALAEKNNLLSLAQAVSTSTPSPSLPAMPQMPKIADAPEVQIPLNSIADRPITVNLPSQDVGRDLSDRGIAHIATGGIYRPW